MKLFSSYLKQHRITIIGYFIFGAVLVISFFLYQLPLAAVLYPMTLCFLIGSGLMAADFRHAAKKHRELAEISKLTSQLMNDLPPADSIEEKDYQKISDQSVQSFLMYKEGKTSLQAYLDTKKERSDWETFFQERRKTLEQKMRMLQKQQKEEAKFLRSLLELEGTSRLNAELVEALVDRISLYGDGHLEIVFKFQGGDGR